MAEILGLGLTHAPSLIRPDEDGESSLKRTLRENKNGIMQNVWIT